MQKINKQPIYQSGQGLIEYAILLLLTITLVIGGAELAATALASNKSSDAAEAGVNEYVEINQRRLKSQENIANYLERLEREQCDVAPCENSDIVNYLDATTSTYSGIDYLWKSYQDNVDGATAIPLFEYDTTVFDITVYNGDTSTDPIEVGVGYTQLTDLINLIDGVTDDTGDGVIDSTDRDNSITSEELYHAIKYHQTLLIDSLVVASEDGVNDSPFDIIQEIKDLDPVTDAGGDTALEELYKIAKYQALILFEHIQLSTLPLDPRVVLSETVPLLADHDVTLMTNPNCDTANPAAIIYDHGFPGEQNDVNGDGVANDGIPHQDIGGVEYPAIYLFNPLPINVATCQGSDSARDNKSLLSILVGGYGQGTDLAQIDTYTSGMPKLHQAYYSQYTRICLNTANEYVSCGGGEVDSEILKPPGKYCLSDTANNTVDSCPNIDADLLSTSGYYFWGRGNDADPEGGERFQWLYGSSDAPVFRPSLQLLCNGESHQSPFVVGESCDSIFDSDGDGDMDFDDDALNRINTVEVNVRYRSVFESFLAFGMQELQDETLLPYFYDPSNLRNIGGRSGVPIAGSELGPKQGALPSVKPFKDFRGCYEVNVDTNQVSACN